MFLLWLQFLKQWNMWSIDWHFSSKGKKSGSEMPITQKHLWIIPNDTRFGLQMWIMNNLYLMIKGCMTVTNIFIILLQKSSFWNRRVIYPKYNLYEMTWWRHYMDTFYTLLVICPVNPNTSTEGQ